MSNNTNRQTGFTIHLRLPHKPLHNPKLWFLLFVAVMTYTLYRDQAFSKSQRGDSTPPQPTTQDSPLLSTTMMTVPDAAGYVFTVDSAKQVNIVVRESSAEKILISRRNGSIVYQIKGSNFTGQKYFEAGQYVVSLVARGGGSATAFIDIK
jgi:hypothetical protein